MTMNPHPCARIRCTGVFCVLCRKKLSSARRRVRRTILRTLAVILALLVYFEIAVRVQLGGVIRAEVKTLAQTAVNEAVSEFLSAHPDVGEKLSKLCFDENGKVTALTTDPAYINYVKAQICSRAQEGVDSLARSKGVEVPLGSFTGLTFLDRAGPDVNLTVGGRSAVACSFKSTFEAAGINQTLHHITLSVSVDMAVYSPFRIGGGVQISSDYEIAQTVIVGSVPTYGGVVTY